MAIITRIFQLSSSVGKDCWLQENESTSSHNTAQLKTGRAVAGAAAMMHILIDPGNTFSELKNVKEARLLLYVESNNVTAGQGNALVRPLLVDWDETATYGQRKSGINWSTAGARSNAGTDCSKQGYSTQGLTLTAGSWITLYLNPAWFENWSKRTHYGFWIAINGNYTGYSLADATNGYITVFSSRTAATQANAPKFEIDFEYTKIFAASAGLGTST